MTSIDTNLLFFAYQQDSPSHPAALDFIRRQSHRSDVAISEFVLVEFYRLLRNSVVNVRPLSAPDAVSVIASYRKHPRWKVVGFPDGVSAKVHDQLWATAAGVNFGARRIYDARMALTLLTFGVTEFATANVKDFEGLGFKRVWNPVHAGS